MNHLRMLEHRYLILKNNFSLNKHMQLNFGPYEKDLMIENEVFSSFQMNFRRQLKFIKVYYFELVQNSTE